MSDFDLRALIRDAFEDTPEPREVWQKVRAGLNEETVWLAVDVMGPDFCRLIGGGQRREAITPAGAERMVHESRSGIGTPKREAACRDRWEQAMRKPLPLGTDGKVPAKMLGDCTPDDISTAEQIRRRIAGSIIVRADQLAKLREAMRINRAKCVRDLEPTLFWEAMR